MKYLILFLTASLLSGCVVTSQKTYVSNYPNIGGYYYYNGKPHHYFPNYVDRSNNQITLHPMPRSTSRGCTPMQMLDAYGRTVGYTCR